MTRPELNESYPLSPQDVTQYQADGHVLLRTVCRPDEIAVYRPFIGAAVSRYSRETRPMEERDTYGKAFLQITNLWTQDEQVRSFVFARRFARIAAQLMGVSGVRLYHDQAFIQGGRRRAHAVAPGPTLLAPGYQPYGYALDALD